MAEKGFLDSVYAISDVRDTRQLYDRWAASYNREIKANGYVTPRRCATALAELAGDHDAPLLDIGCGTGISGMAMAAVGFSVIDGCDLSAAMLEKAARHDRLYRQLWQVDPDNPLDFAPEDYRYISAVGVIASGHAPAATIGAVLEKLPSNGLFVFSLNDHTLEDAAFEAEIDRLVAEGMAAIRYRDYGDHLPGIGLKSLVIILERLASTN